MNIWRQLRWRLVGAQILVVLVGVIVLAVTVQVIALRPVPALLRESLAPLDMTASPDVLRAVTTAVMDSLRRDIWRSLGVAAVAAAVAGLTASILLIREILRPLQELASSSRRIAAGHYDERVAVPPSDELAVVATSFNQMAESLEQVERQRIQLIGDVAHELRTPLTGLRGYLEGLMDGLFSTEGETFAHMYHEVRRMQRLVDDLQALSRVETGQIRLHLQAFDVVALVNRTARQLQPQILAENLRLSLKLGEQSLPVYADPDRVAQILMNLLSNAIRYTPEGGEITVQVRREGRVAAVAVTDTGAGINPEHQAQIFERFYRVDSSRTRRSGGSGVGLTIAQHLVWAMGGDIHVESQGAGQGSTFTFEVPLATAGDTEIRKGAQPGEMSGRELG